MARSVLLIDNDIFADGVSLKRACRVMGEMLAEDYSLKIPQNKLLDIMAVSFGYSNFHEIRQVATIASESLKPQQDPNEERIKAYEASLDKSAEWVKSCAPKKLLEKRSPRWIKMAIHITDGVLFHMSKPLVQKPNITLIVGPDSSLVLKTIANVYQHRKYFSLKHDSTLDMVYQDVKRQIAAHQSTYDIAVAEGKISGSADMKVGRAGSMYHCIAGLAEEPITSDVIRQLVNISDLDPNMSLAINIKRADLLKFTEADLNAPHFHYLTIVDLDLINDVIPRSGSNKSAAFGQSTKGFWVNPRTRHETLFPNIEYRPQLDAV